MDPVILAMPLRVALVSIVVAATVACMLTGCDAASGSYRRSGGGWTYEGGAIAPVDVATFRPLDDRFARDALHGYYRGVVIADSDGATFEALSEHEARDRVAVYWCDTLRKGQEYWSIRHVRIEPIAADAATYRVLGRGYARDARQVYLDGVAFRVRDAATFTPMEGGFGRDSQRGYHAQIEIGGSHGPTFATISADDPAYVRDRSQVWHGSIEPNRPGPGTHPLVRTLRDADPSTLRVLGRGYAIDRSSVWYRGERLSRADAATFVVDDTFVGEADATDRVGRWSRGERLASPHAIEPSAIIGSDQR